MLRHSFSPQPSLEVLYNPLPLRSRPGNRHSRTIHSSCKTWGMGLPKGPRGIEDHTCSVATFIFTTTITGGTVQSTTASKQTRKSAFPHVPRIIRNLYRNTRNSNCSVRSKELSSPWEHPSTVVLWGSLAMVLPEWWCIHILLFTFTPVPYAASYGHVYTWALPRRC